MSNQSSTLHIYVTFMDKGKILIKYSISWLNLQLPFSSSFKIKRKIALTITLLLRLGKTTYIKEYIRPMQELDFQKNDVKEVEVYLHPGVSNNAFCNRVKYFWRHSGSAQWKKLKQYYMIFLNTRKVFMKTLSRYYRRKHTGIGHAYNYYACPPIPTCFSCHVITIHKNVKNRRCHTTKTGISNQLK